MYYVTACIQAQDPYSFEEALKAIQDLEEITNQEEGCKQFHAYALDQQKGQIMLWEKWDNKEALEAHQKSPQTKAFMKKGYTSVVWALESSV